MRNIKCQTLTCLYEEPNSIIFIIIIKTLRNNYNDVDFHKIKLLYSTIYTTLSIDVVWYDNLIDKTNNNM